MQNISHASGPGWGSRKLSEGWVTGASTSKRSFSRRYKLLLAKDQSQLNGGVDCLSFLYGDMSKYLPLLQIVQFAGKCMIYNDAKEWNVTHAILSNSMAVSCQENRLKRNELVDSVMQQCALVHLGWLRQASKSSPLSALDLDTQRVYEKHLPDAFAALLDLTTNAEEPVVYFYCLKRNDTDGTDWFVATQHVVLDSSVPYSVLEVSLPNLDSSCQELSNSKEARSIPSRNSDDTDATLDGLDVHSQTQGVSTDDLMCMF